MNEPHSDPARFVHIYEHCSLVTVTCPTSPPYGYLILQFVECCLSKFGSRVVWQCFGSLSFGKVSSKASLSSSWGGPYAVTSSR